MPVALTRAERPLRLLLTADAVGGVWQHAVDLADSLGRRGVATTLAALGPPPAVEAAAAARAVPGVELVLTGLPLDWTAESPAALRRAGRHLAELAGDCGADVVQLHAPALAGAAAFPVPCVAVCHSCVGTWWRTVRQGPLPEDFRWRMQATARGLTAADATVAPSRSFARLLAATYALRRPPLAIRNGRRRIGPRSHRGGRFAFTAGRLWDEGKDVATLDRAAALTPVPIRAAGPLQGPHGVRLAPSHLRILGPLDDAGIAAQLAEASMFATAARYEPFGLAVLEAAQAGLPLLLADIPTFRELWDGAACFVPSGDAEALARGIDRLAADDVAAARLAAAAARRARRYGVERMARAYGALHRRLLTTKSERRRIMP